MSSTGSGVATLPSDYPDDEAAFSEIIDRDEQLLAYFRADWCRDCEVMDPRVADVGDAGDAGVLWVDVERHPAIAARYDVRAVPTLLAFEGGEPVGKAVGRRERSAIEAILAE